MRLALNDPKLLSDSISVISELVSDAKFKIDSDKLELIAMDPANVAMVAFQLLSSAFTEYKVEKPIELALNLDSFKQILRRAKPSDHLIIELDEEKNKLNIKIKGESTRTFSIGLVDLGERQHKVPKLSFPVDINTSTYVFDEAIEDMSIFADSVVFTVNKERLIVESESRINNAKVEILNDGETKINWGESETTDNVKSKYSIEYLKKISKGSKLADNVLVQFSNDYPLRVEFKVKDKLDLVFILAPRVSEE
ncbi:MAG: proliferating cell nuclear antigen (pcna) [Nanoarchaeota archaeon]